MELSHHLDRLIRKLGKRATLTETDEAALRGLPFETKAYDAGRYLVREGAQTQACMLLLSGFAYRHKLSAEGERQIVSVHVPGDFIDLQGALLDVSDHNVQLLTRSEIAMFPIRAILDIIDTRRFVARALWVETLVESSMHREWVLNVGRRPAPQRIGHLLCEIACRLEFVGLGTTGGYQLPMTQEQLADCTGLTSVHVNRTLKQLDADGYIHRHKRFIEIPDWERLSEMSGFSALYLHHEHTAPA